MSNSKRPPELRFVPEGVTLQPVTSSNIAKLGWHDDTLYVQFATGGLFSYADVTQDVYDLLAKADSIGSHFAKYIRPKYKATDLRKMSEEQLRAFLSRNRDPDTVIGDWPPGAA